MATHGFLELDMPLAIGQAPHDRALPMRNPSCSAMASAKSRLAEPPKRVRDSAFILLC
jgi:hypothetical protein